MESTEAQARKSGLKSVERGPLVVVVTAFALSLVGVSLYAVEPDREWVKVWIPGIAGGLLVGALTVLAINVVLEGVARRAESRRLRPLALAAAEELVELRAKVDRFLENWQASVAQLRGDYLEVLEEEESAALFPETLIARLPFDTYRLLSSGWGQPNHERMLAAKNWKEAVQVAGQMKRQSDRIVEWYAAALDLENLVALARIQEYLLSVVENVPETGQRSWFSDEEPQREFVAEYRALWPEVDPALEGTRKDRRDTQFAIYKGLGEGSAERQRQEENRAYIDPALVALDDELNPPGPREERYLELAMSARAVLDLGCGTGRLLRRAAGGPDSGAGNGMITRDLVGVDREYEMLTAARAADEEISWEESLISWKSGDARTIDVGRHFDLIVMTGGTFLELLSDGEVRMVLSNVIRHLDRGGRFAFDADPIEGGSPSRPGAEARLRGKDGVSVEVARERRRSIDPDLVELATTYTFAGSEHPAVSRSVLRCVDRDRLRATLEEVGFRIDEWFGEDGIAIASYVG